MPVVTLPASISPIRPDNPAELGFPPLLPIELALRTGTPKEICEAYGLTKDDFETLIQSPAFLAAYKQAMETVQKEGMSFKMKAQLQAEALLTQSWALIHSADTPPAVKAQLIKDTVRWAGYEQKGGETGAGAQNAFQININLG